MIYEFAPMEGITGYVYRNVHKRHFEGVDRYFLPFLLPNQTRSFTTREKKDIQPEHNAGLQAVPQVLTNKAEDFLWAANELENRGYTEVNLNLGCPSGTVVSKKKGAGFLGCPQELEQFFEETCPRLNLELSVKTRIGVERPEEFEGLLELFNQYPIKELIVHPRVRRDFYKGEVRGEWVSYVLEHSRHPVSYNGDVVSAEGLKEVEEAYPGLQSIMIGRGLLANPGLLREAKGGPAMTKAELADFHWDLYEEYQRELSGGKNVLYKMKELWFYMFCMFADRAPYEKRMRKVQRTEEYKPLVLELFANLELLSKGQFIPPEKR